MQSRDVMQPGLQETARQATVARQQAEATAATLQSQAAAFIRENGKGAASHTEVTAGQKTGA